MMLARGDISVSIESLVEQFAILHAGYINQSPSWNGASTLSANLPTKQSDDSFLNTVIMRLDNALVALVSESKQMFLFNRTVKKLIQLLVHCHFVSLAY